jgi:hypothetical protein
MVLDDAELTHGLLRFAGLVGEDVPLDDGVPWSGVAGIFV